MINEISRCHRAKWWNWNPEQFPWQISAFCTVPFHRSAVCPGGPSRTFFSQIFSLILTFGKFLSCLLRIVNVFWYVIIYYLLDVALKIVQTIGLPKTCLNDLFLHNFFNIFLSVLIGHKYCRHISKHIFVLQQLIWNCLCGKLYYFYS